MNIYSNADLDELGRRIGALSIEHLSKANTLSDKQVEIVEATGRILAHLAGRRIHGKHCIAGPYGLGKTTSIKSAIAVLGHETDDLGLLVLQQKISAGQEVLREAKEWMQAKGWALPPHFIAHVFTARGHEPSVRPSASRPYRFVLATHERSRRESISLVAFDEHGNLRPTVVDEAMYASWAVGVNIASLETAYKHVLAAYEHSSDPEAEATVSWCTDFFLALQARIEFAHVEAHEQKDATIGREAVNAKLPTIDDADLRERVLRKLDRPKQLPQAKPFVNILEAASRDDNFRLMRTSNHLDGSAEARGMLLQHRRTLSDILRNLVSFDAGAEVDALLALDDGIKLATESLQEFMPAWAREDRSLSRLKDCSAVDVFWMNAPGGKDKLTNHFNTYEPWVATSVAAFVAQRIEKGTSKQVLICVHKDSDAVEKIRAALTKAGIKGSDIGYDEIPEEGRRYRIEFTHWGLHDALNCWQGADTVVAVGSWTFSDADAAAIALGQRGKPDSPTPTWPTIRDVQRSRVATSLGQLAGRGACRRMKDGKADPMTFAFIYTDSDPDDEREGGDGPLVKLLKRLLRNAKWHTWERPSTTAVESQTQKVADLIGDELLRLQQEALEQLSTRALRRRLKLSRASASSEVFSNATTLALERNPQWVRMESKQSIIRAHLAYARMFPTKESDFCELAPAS